MPIPANNFTATSSLLDFDLSRNKSLRTLEVTAGSIVSRFGRCASDRAVSRFLAATLSTITSPAFSEVVVFYRDLDFDGLSFYPLDASNPYREMAPGESAKEALWHRRLFEVFREMHAV